MKELILLFPFYKSQKMKHFTLVFESSCESVTVHLWNLGFFHGVREKRVGCLIGEVAAFLKVEERKTNEQAFQIIAFWSTYQFSKSNEIIQVHINYIMLDHSGLFWWRWEYQKVIKIMCLICYPNMWNFYLSRNFKFLWTKIWKR